MKITYLLPGLIILGALSFYLISCKNKQSAQQSEDRAAQAGDRTKVRTSPANSFQDLRNMALAVTPEQLQITLPANQTKVYGVVMDWDLGEGTATFVSFSTGDASMYLSSGGGVIGGGQHENVHKAAIAFIDKTQQYIGKAIKAGATPLPDKNCVRFYFMTNKGTFTAQEDLKNFDNGSSPWLRLFEEGNKVISELRLVDTKK